MAAWSVLVALPDGQKLNANFPVPPNSWTFEDGREFFDGLMKMAFPPPLGQKQQVVTSVERQGGRLVFDISVGDKAMRVGPFDREPSDAGFQGMNSYLEWWLIERKDTPKH